MAKYKHYHFENKALCIKHKLSISAVMEHAHQNRVECQKSYSIFHKTFLNFIETFSFMCAT